MERQSRGSVFQARGSLVGEKAARGSIIRGDKMARGSVINDLSRANLGEHERKTRRVAKAAVAAVVEEEESLNSLQDISQERQEFFSKKKLKKLEGPRTQIRTSAFSSHLRSRSPEATQARSKSPFRGLSPGSSSEESSRGSSPSFFRESPSRFRKQTSAATHASQPMPNEFSVRLAKRSPDKQQPLLKSRHQRASISVPGSGPSHAPQQSSGIFAVDHPSTHDEQGTKVTKLSSKMLLWNVVSKRAIVSAVYKEGRDWEARLEKLAAIDRDLQQRTAAQIKDIKIHVNQSVARLTQSPTRGGPRKPYSRSPSRSPTKNKSPQKGVDGNSQNANASIPEKPAQSSQEPPPNDGFGPERIHKKNIRRARLELPPRSAESKNAQSTWLEDSECSACGVPFELGTNFWRMLAVAEKTVPARPDCAASDPTDTAPASAWKMQSTIGFRFHSREQRQSVRQALSSESKNVRLQVRIPETLVVGSECETFSFMCNDAAGNVVRYEHRFEEAVVKWLRLTVRAGAEEADPVFVMKMPGPTGNSVSVHTAKDAVTDIFKAAMQFPKVIIQRYVRPAGARAAMTRYMWSVNSAAVGYTVSNVHPMVPNPKSDPYRATVHCSNLSLEHQKLIRVVRVQGRAFSELEDVCARLVTYLETVCEPRIKITSLVADFLCDSEGRWWLLNVKDIVISPDCFVRGLPTEKTEKPKPRPGGPRCAGDYCNSVQKTETLQQIEGLRRAGLTTIADVVSEKLNRVKKDGKNSKRAELFVVLQRAILLDRLDRIGVTEESVRSGSGIGLLNPEECYREAKVCSTCYAVYTRQMLERASKLKATLTRRPSSAEPSSTWSDSQVRPARPASSQADRASSRERLYPKSDTNAKARAALKAGQHSYCVDDDRPAPSLAGLDRPVAAVFHRLARPQTCSIPHVGADTHARGSRPRFDCSAGPGSTPPPPQPHLTMAELAALSWGTAPRSTAQQPRKPPRPHSRS